MLQAMVQQLGDISVLCCQGRIVLGEAYAILRDLAMSQGHARFLVLDLAHVDCIDAGGLGVLLGLREWARSHAISFKLMNVMNRVERILELTALHRVFEFCSVRDLLCLLHRAIVVASGRYEQTTPAQRCEYMATEQRALPANEWEFLLGLIA
jgi:anti-anti-sigma factor